LYYSSILVKKNALKGKGVCIVFTTDVGPLTLPSAI